MTQAVESSITQSVTVDAPRERAFEVFTVGLGDWFPREYNLLDVDIEERTFETREGGRIYDRGTDGSECSWGKVLTYEPPERVVFAWAISTRWAIEEDDEKMSHVEVRFIAESDARTRVDLEHRHLDRQGEGWEALREQLAAEGGWPYTMERFVAQLSG